MLIELLDGREVPSRVHLPAELVVRGSTGPVPSTERNGPH